MIKGPSDCFCEWLKKKITKKIFGVELKDSKVAFSKFPFVSKEFYDYSQNLCQFSGIR